MDKREKRSEGRTSFGPLRLWGSACQHAGQPGDQRREHRAERGHDTDDDNERYNAPVDLLDFDARRQDALHIEQGEAEGRRHEAGLQQRGADGHQPQPVEAEGIHDRQEDGEHDHDDAQQVDEHAQKEHDDHHET